MKNQFYISCAVHFEQELKNEISEVWPFVLDKDGRPHSEPLQIVEEDKGGVLLEAPLHLGLQLNYFLKVAHRVILRWKQKKIKDFPPLLHWLRELKPEEITGDKRFRVKIEASKSRLNNEKRILQVFKEVFEITEDPLAPLLLVRVFDDVFTLSWDTSGEHLHKRTSRTEHGDAPLRETLAAFCIRQMTHGIPLEKLKKTQWIDPMAGSGTLLLEAINLYQPVKGRGFAFQSWKVTPGLLKSKDFSKNFVSFPTLGIARAFDIDPEMVRLMKGRGISAVQQDIFDGDKDDGPHKGLRLVVSNPPYGERLPLNFKFENLVDAIHRKFEPDLIGVLVPQGQAQSLKAKRTPLRSVYFLNGGLPVEFVIFSKL